MNRKYLIDTYPDFVLNIGDLFFIEDKLIINSIVPDI